LAVGDEFYLRNWSVLVAFNAAGVEPASAEVRRAVDWLMARQHGDGGWGESGESYWPEGQHGDAHYSTHRDSLALLGLMAAGQSNTQRLASASTTW